MVVPIQFGEAWNFSRQSVSDLLSIVGKTFRQPEVIEFATATCSATTTVSFAGFGEVERIFQVSLELYAEDLAAEAPRVRPLITCCEIEGGVRTTIHQTPVYEENSGYLDYDDEDALRRCLVLLEGKVMRRLCAKINERLTDHTPKSLRHVYRK